MTYIKAFLFIVIFGPLAAFVFMTLLVPVVPVVIFGMLLAWLINDDPAGFFKLALTFLILPIGLFANGVQAARGKPPVYSEYDADWIRK